MKEYYVSDLYKLEIDCCDDIRYLICDYDRFKNCYSEIFTNDKFFNITPDNIERLKEVLPKNLKGNITITENELKDIYKSFNKKRKVSKEDSKELDVDSRTINNLNKNEMLKVVKFYIESVNYNSDNYIISDNISEASKNCDLVFRNNVVEVLSKMGIPIEVIEEGLEKYSKLWKNQYMNMAFDSMYNPLIGSLNPFRDSSEDNAELKPASDEFRKLWLLIRKYEYYMNHIDSVNKYGKVNKEMIMPELQVNTLRKLLKEQEIKRLKEIDDFKLQNDSVLYMSKVLSK